MSAVPAFATQNRMILGDRLAASLAVIYFFAYFFTLYRVHIYIHPNSHNPAPIQFLIFHGRRK